MLAWSLRESATLLAARNHVRRVRRLGGYWQMRVLGPAIAGLLAGLSLADLPAEAGSRYGARIEQLP